MENVSASVSAAIATTRPPPAPVAVAVRPVEQSAAAKNNTARSGSPDGTQANQTTTPQPEQTGEKKEAFPPEKARKLPAHLRDLNIEFDKATQQVVFQSLDPESGEVDHQFPTELMLKLAANLGETVGVLVDDKV